MKIETIAKSVLLRKTWKKQSYEPTGGGPSDGRRGFGPTGGFVTAASEDGWTAIFRDKIEFGDIEAAISPAGHEFRGNGDVLFRTKLVRRVGSLWEQYLRVAVDEDGREFAIVDGKPHPIHDGNRWN